MTVQMAGRLQSATAEGQQRGLKVVSIQRLIEWAFQKELASLDFNEVQSSSGWVPPSVSMEYRMMQQARLGCRVDGGGHSDPHHDADIVASAMAALPEARGGRRTALWMAELARAGREPDWMDGAVPRLYPDDVHTNRHGRRARTADASTLGSNGWPAQPRRNKKQIVVHEKVMHCPCHWRPTQSQIGAARRSYLHWWAALLELRTTFQLHSNLTAFVVNDVMPVMEPWKKHLTKS